MIDDSLKLTLEAKIIQKPMELAFFKVRNNPLTCFLRTLKNHPVVQICAELLQSDSHWKISLQRTWDLNFKTEIKNVNIMLHIKLKYFHYVYTK